MAESCINLNVFGNTEEEKTLLSWYDNETDTPLKLKPILVATLNKWRAFYGKSQDEFPKTKSSFTRFYNNRLKTAESATSPYDISDTLWEDINDVNNGNVEGLGPMVLENRLHMVASMFTDAIDKYQNTHKTYSRARCLSEMGGVDKVIKTILSDLASLNNEDIVLRNSAKFQNKTYNELTEDEKKDVEYIRKAYSRLNDYADSISVLCRKYINEYELGINADVYTQDGEDVNELKGKRYIDFRTVDVSDTITSRAKNILSKLYVVDKNGNTVLDDIGFPIRITTREALQTLVQYSWTSTPETFIEDLRGIQDSYGWVKTLLSEIENNKVKKAAIFTASKKARMLYSYIILEKGTYLDKRLNTMAAHDSVLRTISLNWGNHILNSDTTLYNESGGWMSKGDPKERVKEAIGKWDNLFGEPIPGWDKSIRANVKYIDTSTSNPNWRPKVINARSININGNQTIIPEHYGVPRKNESGKAGIEAMRWYLDTFRDEVDKLAMAAQGFGLNISSDDIVNAAMIPIGKKDKKFFNGNYSNRYEAIVSCIQSLYSSLVSHNTIEKALIAESSTMRDLMTSIGLSKYYDVDSKGDDNGKIRQTYITPNLLSELMIDLRNDRKESSDIYIQKLKDKYLKYEGFTLNGQPTGLLEYLINNPEQSQNIVLGNESSFNRVDYADMKRQQTGSMQYVMWRGSKYENPKFIIPVSADYTVCYYLQVPKDSLPSNEGESLVVERDDNGIPVKYNTEASIVTKLSDEVLCEYNRIKAIEDRIVHGGENRAILLTYEKEGRKFHIFPEMNTSGLRERLESETSSVDQLELIKNEVADLLYKNYLKDISYYAEQGIFNNPEFKKVLKVTNGRIEKILDDSFEIDFENFSFQTFYMRLQATKLVFGDTSHFKNILDFEKRAMMQHSPATPIYYESLGDSEQNVVYLQDIKSGSVYENDFREMLDTLAGENMISENQVSEFMNPYSYINVTDGQGFRTLPSWKRIREGLGKWSDEQEEAYLKIMRGEITKDNIDALGISVNKLRYSGYQEIDATVTGTEGIEQKPVRTPVFHKYSEQVLLPWHLMKNSIMETSNSPVMGLAKFAYEMELAKNKGVDVKVPELFLFHSGCKVGAHDIIDPWHNKDGSDCTTSEQIARRVRECVTARPTAMQTLNLSGLGEAAMLDIDTKNTEIHITSQAEKIAYGNIRPDDTIDVIGKGKMDAVDGRRLYDEISATTVVDTWQKLCDEIGNYTAARRILLKEMGNMSYVSEETKLALTRVRNLGKDTLPLFSPQVQHEAQAIMLSIIKNRMQKHKAPGARFVQKTSLGWDMGSVEYSEGLSKEDKLHIVFDGTGKNKRIKYVEAYVPITDSRLEAFTNVKGEITAERLNELVADGIIPEEMLYCVGYRTPSDAEHSIIPIKIKGFLSSASGNTVILPREVMIMTGHDYDGDEMPIHFHHFKDVKNEKRIRNEFDDILKDKDRISAEFSSYVRYLLEQGNEEEAFEEFSKAIRLNPQNTRFFSFETYTYDYSKSPLEQSQDIRERTRILDNEKLKLLFGQVSSPSYTRRMLIPGGCEETKRTIKTLQLLKLAKDNPELRKRIADIADAKDTNDVGDLFMYVRGLNIYNKSNRPFSSEEIDTLINDYQTPESPFTARHTVESFGYMIESANMIGIFAMYMSSFQMLQKANVTYLPYTTTNDKGELIERPTTLFGKDFNYSKMFDVKDITGYNMLSRVMSRLINAAVDNGKDPILGLVNICPEVAPLMVTMCGLGMTEDQIDLIITQPSIVEALTKTAVDHISFKNAIEAVLSDIEKSMSSNPAEQQRFNSISYKRASDDLRDMTESEYARETVKKLEDMMYPVSDEFGVSIPDYEGLTLQKKILYQVRQLNDAASDLESFIKYILRPESASGGVSSTIGNTQGRLIAAQDCQRRIADGSFRIGGLQEIAKSISFYDCMTSEELLEESKSSPVPQYTLMRILEVESSMEFMKRWFPQARESWQNIAERIAKMYGNTKIPEKLLDRIYKDMILWKILGHGSYSAGADASEREENFNKMQNHLLSEVPYALNSLQDRILKNAKLRKEKEDAKAELERLGDNIDRNRKTFLEQKLALKTDWQLDALEKNSFLMQLKVYHEAGTKLKPRIQFKSGGIDMSKMSDTIRRDWGMMLSDAFDDDVRELASDLVDYGLFVNGFGFGRYEFGHFASMYLMTQANNGRLINAMQDICDSDFDDDAEIDNFITQYIQNHWQDKGLVPKLKIQNLTGRLAEQFGIENPIDVSSTGAVTEDRLTEGEFYLIVSEKQSMLMRYNGETSEDPFTRYEKLGTSNKYGQVTVEYNPNIEASDMKPFQIGDDSQWDTETLDPYGPDVDYSSMPDLQNVPDSVYQDELDKQQGQIKVTLEDKIKARMWNTDPLSEARKRVEMDRKNAELIAEEKKQKAQSKQTDSESQVKITTSEDTEMSIDEINALISDTTDEDRYKRMQGLFEFSIAHMITDENGNRVIKTDKVPGTPEGVAEARKRNSYIALNARLRNILESVGVGVGKLNAEDIIAFGEEELAVAGISDFDTAKTLANGLIELIRVADGEAGELALPEEFSHVAIQMLGTEHPLVQRLFNAIRNDDEALREAYGEDFDLYKNLYQNNNGDLQNRLVEEAAGKILAKKLLYRQEVQTSKLRSLIQRIVDAFNTILRKIGIKRLQDAILDSDTEASLLAKELLSGKLLDEMNLNKISSSSKFYSASQNITDAQGTIEKLIKIEAKRADIYERRLGRDKKALNNSVAYTSTVTEMNALKAALRNHKTEDAVLGYMGSTLQFLQRMEAAINDSIRKGESANAVSSKLNMLRDTLFSNIQALDAIREGLAAGEITDSGSVQKTIDETAGIVQDFFNKYHRISREYFENMLTSVYGPNGIDITVGKNKGKHISIHDMAIKGEEYSGIQIDAMINSMADQRDYVLKAFDSVVREAKFNARKQQDKIAERLSVAISKLENETGSLDQSFMFARDEKGHKTGRYISAKAAEKLSPAKKAFYDEMIAIKELTDKLLPEHRIRKNGIICIRKGMMQKAKEASGIKNKWQAIKNHIDQSMTSYAEEEYDTEKVYVDFEGNRVDMLPIKYISKGKKESYDDMTDDVASSMMAYVGMATEFNEMHKVINILENAKFASMERNIIQKSGRRNPTETIENNGFEFSQTFTVKQAHTTIQKCLGDFMSMHVYGHLHKATGYFTLFGKKIPHGKVVDVINSITSYSQMAINIPQRISNVTTGFSQILIQTAGKDYFGAKDVLWASGIYMKESPDRLAETGADASHNKLSLFNERFDIGQRYNDESKKKHYGKSRAAKVINTHLLYAGLELGEDYLASTTGLSIARNTKVLLNGKEINLYDAYDVVYRDENNKIGAYLKLKDGVTKLDGSEFTQKDELAFSKKCAAVNFKLQGIYNTDDRAAIQQYPLGALIIMYRKWIAPSLKRRYGAADYNELTGTEEQGYHRTAASTTWNILKNIVKDGESIKNSIAVNWNNLTEYEKSNCKKSATEFGILAGITLCLSLLDNLPPDDDSDEKTLTWRDNVIIYQVLRLRNELGSQAPTPMLVQEATKILSSPMACIRLFDNALKGLKLLNPFNYFGEDSIISEENKIKSGRFKGHTQAYKYFWSLPILSMRKSVENLIDPEPLINYYK